MSGDRTHLADIAIDRHDLLRLQKETIRHIEDGERMLARQRQLVAELEAQGEDATLARSLMQSFEDLQRLHVRHLARLEKLLARTIN